MSDQLEFLAGSDCAPEVMIGYKITPGAGKSKNLWVDIVEREIRAPQTGNEVLDSYLRLMQKQHGGRFLDGCWRYPLTAALDLSHMEGLMFSPAFSAYLERCRAQRGDMTPLQQHILTFEFDPDATLPNGFKLYEHQKKAVAFMRENLRCILADDMGLGKTIVALIVSKIIYEALKFPTVIITKSSLINDWQKAARELKHPHFTVYSWSKIPELDRKITLILDEAHMAQNITAQRTKKALKLAESAIAVYALTGTPIPNGDPANLLPVLKMIKHEVAENTGHFMKYFCKRRLICGKGKAGYTLIEVEGVQPKINWVCQKCRKQNRFTYHFGIKRFACIACGKEEEKPKVFPMKGAANLEELHEKIAPYMLRRMKEQCLDLPEKTLILRDLEISEEMAALYHFSFEKAKNDYKARVSRGETAKEAEALALLNYMRQAASRAKVGPACEMAEEVLEQKGSVLIFTAFKESCEQIAERFKVHPYHGSTRIDVRNKIVEDFQARKTRVFPATLQAGGTGLTLTAANTVLLVDRELVPGANAQALDRAHRIGQHWPVTGYWLRAFHVCRKIDDLLENKMGNIETILTGGEGFDVSNIKANDVLRDLFEGENKE